VALLVVLAAPVALVAVALLKLAELQNNLNTKGLA
jgi:hypothetical protein